MASLYPPPSAELHVHLRGAMPASYFGRLLARRSPVEALADAPQRHLDWFGQYPHLRPFLGPESDPDRAAEVFEFSDLRGFLASYLLCGYFIRSEQDFRELLDAVADGFVSQGIRYAEVTVSVPEYVMHGIELQSIANALSDAASRRDVELRWIVDLVRNLGADAALALLRRLLQRPPRGWVGITLGGSEAEFPPGLFVEVYDLARAHGLGLSVHAGEAAGPESVWEALRRLRVDRIGHGVRSIEAPRLVEYLAEREIPLEVCLTGNVRTGVYPELRDHPLPRLVEAGVPVTLNTDDPTFFATTLTAEFEAARLLGINDEALSRIADNARRYAFDGRRERTGGALW